MTATAATIKGYQYCFIQSDHDEASDDPLPLLDMVLGMVLGREEGARDTGEDVGV